MRERATASLGTADHSPCFPLHSLQVSKVAQIEAEQALTFITHEQAPVAGSNSKGTRQKEEEDDEEVEMGDDDDDGDGESD